MLFCSQVNGTEADFEYEEITLERVSGMTSAALLFFLLFAKISYSSYRPLRHSTYDRIICRHD